MDQRFDWKADAMLSFGLGEKEWINATLKTKAKSFKFFNTDQFIGKKRTPFPVDVDACPYGIRIKCTGIDKRELSVVLSPALLSQLIVAYGAEAAKAGEDFPFAEAARALTRAQTSIVNRKK